MSATAATLLARLGGAFRSLLGRRLEPIRDGDALRRFLQTRASYVAQMTLYGYLRTRAGVRFPELFDDDAFVASVNIAKWHVWLACLADLAAYAGGMLRRQAGARDGEVGDVICRLVDEILSETGTPHDAGRNSASMPRGCAPGCACATGAPRPTTRGRSARVRPRWCTGRRWSRS